MGGIEDLYLIQCLEGGTFCESPKFLQPEIKTEKDVFHIVNLIVCGQVFFY